MGYGLKVMLYGMFHCATFVAQHKVNPYTTTLEFYKKWSVWFQEDYETI